MLMRRRSIKDSHHLTGSRLPSEILQAASKSRPWPPPGLSNSPPHTIKSKYLKNWTEGGRGVKNLTIAVPSVICSFWSPERASFNVFYCLLWIGLEYITTFTIDDIHTWKEQAIFSSSFIIDKRSPTKLNGTWFLWFSGNKWFMAPIAMYDEA